MLNNRAYVPDKFRPLVPPPPPIHKNPSIDRELMLAYARKRYYAQLTVEIDD
jgi:hypothetical protein